jgi:hypothetical protein
MTFYGKDAEQPTSAKTKRFYYLMPDVKEPVGVNAQHVFFYESGHVGFWNDAEGDDRVLVMAVKASEVWEDEE